MCRKVRTAILLEFFFGTRDAIFVRDARKAVIMELDRNIRRRLGYAGSKQMEHMRNEAMRDRSMLHKAVYVRNRMVPADKTHLVATVAQAFNNGEISEAEARDLLNRYGV
jgi:hypothetical protein